MKDIYVCEKNLWITVFSKFNLTKKYYFLPKERSRCSHGQRKRYPASQECPPASYSDDLYAAYVLCAFQSAIRSME